MAAFVCWVIEISKHVLALPEQTVTYHRVTRGKWFLVTVMSLVEKTRRQQPLPALKQIPLFVIVMKQSWFVWFMGKSCTPQPGFTLIHIGMVCRV